MNLVTRMIRHSSAREESINIDERSAQRKLSYDAVERKTRNGSILAFDFERQTPTMSTVRKERLLKALKKEVKNVMEESVNRKKVDIKSSYVVSLCSAVEQCLLDGMKRQMLGLFGVRSTYALLHNVAKFCPDAAIVLSHVVKLKDNEQIGCPSDILWIRVAIKLKKLPAIIGFVHGSLQ